MCLSISQSNKRCFGISWISTVYKYIRKIPLSVYSFNASIDQISCISSAYFQRFIHLNRCSFLYLLLCPDVCVCECVCMCVCLSVANVARSQQLLSNKLSAVRVKRQEAAVKTMRRCLAESPKSQSRKVAKSQLARCGQGSRPGQSRPGQARADWGPFDHSSFVYPANASRVVCRGLRGKARPEWKSARGLAGLMIRPGPGRGRADI